VKLRNTIATLGLIGLLAGAGMALAGDGKSTKDTPTFGALRPMSIDAARAQAQAWLKSVGKTDDASQKAFAAIWAQNARSILERVADTLSLGDASAAKLMAIARDAATPAPQEVPAALKDAKQSVYYRSNLALAYAVALSHRRVYEEALDALKLVKPESVVDPAAYLFHRAVAEHSMALKEDATHTIIRLLDDATEVPERYKTVAVLMAFDMQAWREKDLSDIARKMDNIERRLELARGGPKTQKMQKDVVARLDEIIKQLENQQKGDSNNGGSCPNGGQPGNPGGTPSSPQRDSMGGKNSGPGNVDPKKLDGLAKQWGKLPEKERAQAMQELTRDMPPKYREIIESYFRKLAASESNRP
jgi:hypothetical protein